MVNGKAKKITFSAVFVAVALVLSLVERWIPAFVPVPGFRLGLANVAILLSMYILGPVSGAWIMLIKCVLASVFSGAVTAAVYSLCGGVLAYTVMLGAMSLKIWSPVGVSVLGAGAHTVGQIVASFFMMGTAVTVVYLPALLICAAVTGVITGVISSWILIALKNIYRNRYGRPG